MSDTARLAAIHARLQGRDGAGAAQEIAGYLERFPQDAAGWHLAGIVRRQTGDAVGAVVAFTRAIELGKDSAEVRNSLALAHEQAGALDQAMAEAEKAHALEPGYLPALSNLVQLLVKNAGGQEAYDLVVVALAKSPTSIPLLLLAADIAAQTGARETAAEHYNQVLQREPAHLAAASRRARILCEMGRETDALKGLESLPDSVARDPAILYAAGTIEGVLGQTDRALETLLRAIQAAPANFAAHRAYARVVKEHALPIDPYGTYRSLTAKWPREPSIWFDWLSLLVSFLDYADVRAVLPYARAATGNLPPYDYAEAMAESELGDPARAEAFFERAAAGAAFGADFLVARARNAFRRGEPGQAQALAEDVLAEDPHDQHALAYLGLAWRMLEDAREFWLHDYDRQVAQMPLDYLSDAREMGLLRATLRALHTAACHPPEQSLRKGTQTTGPLFARSDPTIGRLKAVIEGVLAGFVGELPEVPAHPFYGRKSRGIRIEGSWSVRLAKAGFHVPHLHARGWISSALHIVQPDPAREPSADAGALSLGEPPEDLRLNLPPRRVVTPVEGALVLFPSSMWHGTKPFTRDAERLTVAFDVVPT